jgi:hypothetical protein
LKYKGWIDKEENMIEWFYINPLEKIVKELRKEMFILYMKGKSSFNF